MNTQQILGNSCIWGERQGNGTGQGNLNLRDLLLFLIFNPKQTKNISIIFSFQEWKDCYYIILYKLKKNLTTG